MMNRLHKKCLIASAGMHVLLVVILFVGPGFIRSPKSEEPPIVIDFLPSKLVDAAVTGGGNPRAQPPAQAPLQVQPPAPQVQTLVPRQPEPEPQPVRKQPDPPKAVVKESKPEPDDEPPPQKPKVVVNLNRVKRDSQTKPAVNTSKAQEVERQAAEARKRAAASRLLRAAENVRNNAAPSTTIEDFGPGGGGPAYASFKAWVQKVYTDAWLAPEDTTSNEALAKATVTIASDGTIISARLTTRSGDSAVDSSVVRTLERVKSIGLPFPDGAREKQRTYIINFNLKAKRLLG